MPKAKDIVSSFVGFATKYTSELNIITNVLEKLVNSSAILKDEKIGIKKAISTLNQNVNSLSTFISKEASNIPTVVIKQSDIDEAVARYFAEKEKENASEETPST